MGFNNEKFRELMLKAIDNDSRAEFARRCGITPQHLSRLMSDKNNVQPSKTTLKKISDNSSVSYEELIVACGHKSSLEELRNSLDMKERAKSNAMDMIGGFEEMTKNTRLYQSLHDFLEDYKMLYSTETMSFHVGDKEEYFGNKYKNAEYFVNAVGLFRSRVKECKTWFVIYFCETKGGKYLITNVSLSGNDLFESGVISTQIADQMYEDGENVNALPYLFQIKKLPGVKSAEEAFLEEIFGNNHEEIPYPIIGFGFDLDGCPENFESFLENHKESFCKDEETTDLYNKVMSEKNNPETALATLEDAFTADVGYGAAISVIMREETDIPFGWYVDNDQDLGHVMLSDEASHPIGQDELKDIVYKYAKELGLKEYGECIAMKFILKDTNRVYKIQEG